MKKIIVTGATGFIGRRLLPLLVKKYGKKSILCLVKKNDSTYEKAGRKVLDKLGVNIKSVNLDNGSGLENLPNNITQVFHLAAKTDTSEKGHYNTNYLGTKRLLEALQLNTKSHVIYTSTTALMSGRRNCSKPINEKSTPVPTNEYGMSKLSAERYLIKKSKCNFKLTILRFPTVYGPNPRKNSFFDILNNFAQRQSFFFRLNWPGKTSLVHVDDVAGILVKIGSKSPRKEKHSLLIVSAESIRFDGINEKLYTALGISYQKVILPNFFWQAAAYLRMYIPFLERFLPRQLYNFFWRSSLLVDNVIDCKPINLPLLRYRFKKLDDEINTLIPPKMD